MDSVSDENVERIMKETGVKRKELEMLESKKVENIWLEELEDLRETYLELASKIDKSVIANKTANKTTNKTANKTAK